MDVEVSKKEQSTLEALNSTYTYETDAELYGQKEVWVIPTGTHVRDDCDGYVLALLYRLTGQSLPRTLWHLLTGRTRVLYYERANVGHAALLYRSETGEKVQADSACRRWHDGTPLTRVGFTLVKAYSPARIMAKLAMGVVWRVL